ncbi:MAG TPA: hypothetical protein PLJ40_01485 [Paludibacteraceae bacterium]|nr:hypothetical protein [Paludibacteraceae bacterium]HQB69171.1 hypothetical protein [Paludibacteraceae bacterium]
MKKLLIAFMILPLFTACSFMTSEVQELRSENDSLRLVKSQIEREVNMYLKTMNEIEQNLDRVKELEGYLSLQSNKEGVEIDQTERINKNIALVTEIVQKNQAEIDRLNKDLKRSGLKIKELESSVKRLTLLVEQQRVTIDTLLLHISQKDSLIAQQQVSIKGLHGDVSALRSENEQRQQTISRQDEALHAAWYVFGTRKELKAQKIISMDGLVSKVLQSDFNKDYFVKIDSREVKEIPLYAKRVKMLTNHPKTAYRLEKQDGQYTLFITDTKAFWSVSKYLVVEVD